ncbi:MAG: glycoside hydrolase family 1 protein [Patescibacteria group bacterium]
MPKSEKILKFPKGFLWGASTSAYQIEGGIKNDWSEWERNKLRIKNLELKGLNPDDFICGQACDSYHRYEEDLNLCLELNCNAYRMGIEWARIEPKEGQWDMKEIEHYRKVLQAAKKRKLKIFLTLWHWTNPVWVRDLGGWENKKVVSYYLRYVEKIVGELGRDVDFWLTMNEPETYIGLSYAAGVFPPQVKSLRRADKVFKNLMKAHRQAYQLIHKKIGKKAQVSLSHYLIFQTPYENSFFNKLAVKILDYVRWQRFFKASKGYNDFIGFQYYHHDRIRLGLGGKFKIGRVDNENKKINDLGWEIYPEGIYYLLKRMKKYKKPIYITENGTADKDDDHRANFVKENLNYIHEAIREGVNVRGYFHWSLMDNFEWADGWAPKFGLYEVDRGTFKRTARPSAKTYAEICKKNSVES